MIALSNKQNAWLPWTLLALLGAAATPALAQNTAFGEIRGVATDPTSSTLSGVRVRVTNLDAGGVQNLVTNGYGVYDTASSLPGKYRLTFSLAGFKTLVRGPITLSAEMTRVDAQPALGEVTQEVFVASDASLLRLDSSEQSLTLDSETMRALPQIGSNGQDWRSFVITLPGTAGTPSAPRGTVNPGTGVAVNGNLPFYASVLADGATVTLPQNANFDSSAFETVSQVVLTTSIFSAQYGSGGRSLIRSPSGQQPMARFCL